MFFFVFLFKFCYFKGSPPRRLPSEAVNWLQQWYAINPYPDRFQIGSMALRCKIETLRVQVLKIPWYKIIFRFFVDICCIISSRTGSQLDEQATGVEGSFVDVVDILNLHWLQKNYINFIHALVIASSCYRYHNIFLN